MITLNLHVPAVSDTQPAFTCSKSVIKTPRQYVQSVNIRTNTRRPSGVFIVKFEQVSCIVLLFPLFTLKK